MTSAPLPRSADILVVGGGLSGLSCARILREAGRQVHVIEASDAVGGRIRTDVQDGFLMDRGFQVLLTAYEELRRQVDMDGLDLREFDPGSLVWNGRSLDTLVDPFRNPGKALHSLMARTGDLGDKGRVAWLRQRLISEPATACFAGPERSTQRELEALGFSQAFIDGFFRPFMGGVFLERELATSASLFRYFFRCFALGSAALPAKGMQRLPELLARPLEGHLTLKTRALEVSPTGVTLEGGRHLEARTVVVAADGAAQAALLGTPSPTFKATVTSYFAASQPPTRHPLLVLDGEGVGPVNHVAVVSNVAPDYAPVGMHLIAASGVGSAADDADAFPQAAQAQLSRWFGPALDGWDHLRTYRIPHALPHHPPRSLAVMHETPRRSDGLIVAGDHQQFGSIQGALASGRRAAEAALEAGE